MTYKFNTTAKKVNEGIKVIRSKGGNLYEDDTFEVSGVEGTLKYDGEGGLTIKIIDKPFLASWDMIETKLNKLYKGIKLCKEGSYKIFIN